MSQVKDLYVDWNELEKQIKALRQSQSEMLSAYSKSRDVKKGDLVKAFKAKKRLDEKNEDELDTVVTLFQELELKDA